MKKIKVAVADDHILFRSTLIMVLNSFDNILVTIEAGNGKELIDCIEKTGAPDIILLDLNMPYLGGFETVVEIKKLYPEIKIIILTMFDSDVTFVRLFQKGINSYLKKNISISELKIAIKSVAEFGHYFSSDSTYNLARMLSTTPLHYKLADLYLNDQQVHFLKKICTDLTYKEIAAEMSLSVRAVDSMRDELFMKFSVKNRVALAMVAVKNGLVGG